LNNDLQTLENAISLLKALTKDKKDSLDRMMSGIYDVYSQIVETLEPFYGIINSSMFNSSFKRYVEEFKKKYTIGSEQIDWYEIHTLHIRCGDVAHVLNKLAEAEGKDVEKIKKLRDSRQLWFQEDNKADLSIEEFFRNLNDRLSDIKNYEELQSFLSDSKIYYDKIRTKLIPYSEKRKELYTIVEDTYLNNTFD
jgi:hypothetical protein